MNAERAPITLRALCVAVVLSAVSIAISDRQASAASVEVIAKELADLLPEPEIEITGFYNNIRESHFKYYAEVDECKIYLHRYTYKALQNFINVQVEVVVLNLREVTNVEKSLYGKILVFSREKPAVQSLLEYVEPYPADFVNRFHYPVLPTTFNALQTTKVRIEDDKVFLDGLEKGEAQPPYSVSELREIEIGVAGLAGDLYALSQVRFKEERVAGRVFLELIDVCRNN